MLARMEIKITPAVLALLVCSGLNLAAQSLDARITRIRERVAPKIRPDRVPSAGERLSEVLDQTRTTLRNISSDPGAAAAAIREERGKLAVLNEAYETEFSTIEAKLRRANLPPAVLADKLAKWHAFTVNYRQRMAASLASFDRVSQSASSHDSAWLRDAVEKLRAGLGTESRSRITEVADRPRSKLQAHSAPVTILPPEATDPPTSDDLAADTTVVLSPDIVAQAKSLGNSPAALFAYVYNNIQFVPYYMSVQNSESALWSGKGNDADQATLLIALLRAAGIPARYASGYINVPVADAISWLGVKDKATAFEFLNFNTIVTDQGSSFNILHVWAEVWLNTPRGNAWVPMTPSIKRQTFQPGIVIPEPAFDRAKFLSSVQTRLSSEIYAAQVLAAFQQAYPGQDFSAMPYTGTITPLSGDTLPSFPYPPLRISARGSSLPGHTIGVLMGAGNTQYFSSTVSMPQVSSTSLTIGFIPATANDQSIINKFGGLANTPAGMVNLFPQLLVNEQVVATGTVEISYGSEFVLRVIHTESYATSPTDVLNHGVVAGDNIAITVGYNQISEPLIASRMDALLSQLPTADPNLVSRELVAIAGLRYFERVEQEKQRVFTPLQIASPLPFVEECATSASVKVTNLFDLPFLVTPADLLMDAQQLAGRGYDLNARGTESLLVPGDLNASRAFEAASSSLENEIWEELALTPSISTIKALQLNGQAGIPTLVLNSSNAASLSNVDAPSVITKSVASDIKSGSTDTISEQATVFGVWSGFGWIVEGPDSFEYAIEQTNTPADGGTSGGNPPQPPGQSGPTGNNSNTNGTNCSDPVNVSNGNMFLQQVDLFASSRGPATLIQRTYNSLSAGTNGPFGYGWAYNYAMALKDNQTSVTFIDDSGGVFSFALSGGVYVSPPGLDLTLTKSAQGYTVRSTHGTVWGFNTSGQLISITDRNHNSATLSYSGTNLSTITDALGRVVTLNYDGSGHIVAIQDFAGRKVAYTYDASGNLASMTDAAGNTTKYAYYTASPFSHLLQTVTKPAGNSTSYEYFSTGQTARVSDSAGRNMRFFYLPLANETIFVDPRGYAASFYYNALGNVTRMIKADGNYRDYTFTADAKPSSITDEDGFTSKFVYDTLGNLTSATDALGNAATLTYDPTFSQVTSITNPLGATTQLQYDASGNLTMVTQPLGVNVQFTYDGFGEMLTVTDGAGNTRTFSYDGSGNVVSATDALNNATKYQYDALRRLIGVTDALGNSSSAQWDALNRLTSLVDPLGATWSAAYDGNGNLAQSIDANGNKTSFFHDPLDNLAQVKDARGGVTQYSYATPNCGCMTDTELTGFRDAAGVNQSQTYDFNQWLTQTADPVGNAASFIYDARGDLVSKTDANGKTIQFKYDADGRLLQKTFPDGTTTKFAYDADGSLVSASNANATITFAYDALNRMVTTADSRFGQTVQYGYDDNSRRTSMTDPTGGVTNYTYDADNRVTSITNPSGGGAQFSYDAASRRTSLQYSNLLSTSYQYNASSRPTSAVTTGAGPHLTYTYDSNRNPTSIGDTAGAHAYQFDQLNRVTAATNPGAAAESYSYDSAGNRLSSASGAYEYDVTGRLTAAEGFSFTYDKNGNLISRTGSSGTTAYTYDFENRLIAIKSPSGTATYEYDALGRRIQKNVNGAVTNYLYDGNHIFLEMNGGGGMSARYTHGPGTDQMLTMERNGQTYFYHINAIGSVVTLTDSSGNAACSYSYDSFGSTQACTAVSNPFAFTGREYDSESGLYYMRARYYDPATGRFSTVDPLNIAGRITLAQSGQRGALAAQATPQQINAYAYATNNPLVFRDPSGMNCVGPVPPINQVPYEIQNTGLVWIAQSGNNSYLIFQSFNGPNNIITAPAGTIWAVNGGGYAAISPNGTLPVQGQLAGNLSPSGSEYTVLNGQSPTAISTLLSSGVISQTFTTSAPTFNAAQATSMQPLLAPYNQSNAQQNSAWSQAYDQFMQSLDQFNGDGSQ